MLLFTHHKLAGVRLTFRTNGKRHPLSLCTTLCNWMLDFLIGRSQLVRIANHISSSVTIDAGVPQSCVLIPLLCYLYFVTVWFSGS